MPISPGQVYRGPFLGLDTTSAPGDLSPAHAIEATNVVLSEGRVRARAPYADYSNYPMPVGVIVGMFEMDLDPEPPSGTKGYETMLLVKTQDGKLWRVNKRTAALELPTLTQLSHRPPTWVVIHRRVHILDGSDPMFSTNGRASGTYTIGIEPPHLDTHVFYLGVGGPGTPGPVEAGTYEYAITFYDYYTQRESNPLYMGPYTYNGLNSPRWRVNHSAMAPATLSHITSYRFYRRNVSLNLPFYRLAGWITAWSPGVWIDGHTDDQLTEEGLSNPVSGPFAPSRNGVPAPATVGWVYKDRLYHNDMDDGSLLRYCAGGMPDHEDPDDYITLSTRDNDGITGMAEMAGQLIVAKERSIWVISGDRVGPTNQTNATGADVDETYPEVHDAKAHAGCANAYGGNGVLVAGTPAAVYYNAIDGFYRFDGANERMVSARIRPTWEDFVSRSDIAKPAIQGITYAHDRANQLIMMCQTGLGMGTTPPVTLLVYHYGVTGEDGIGAWTTWEIDDHAAQGWPTAICTPIGVDKVVGLAPDLPDQPVEYAGYIVGTNLPRVFISRQDRQGEGYPMPLVRYKTGRMVMVDGFSQHFYMMKWLHTHPYVVWSQKCRFGFQIGGRGMETFITKNLGSGITQPLKLSTKQPIRRTGDSISLIFETAPGADRPPYWYPETGLVGFAIDSEPVGQR